MTGTRNRPIRVVHLITDLDIGGAELMLARLVEILAASTVESTVVSLTSGGALTGSIAASGVRVIELDMRRGRLNAAGMYRAFRILRTIEPDVLQTWLYHADLIGLVAGTLARVPVIIWNIRCAALDARDHPASLPLLLRMLAWASRWPSAVVCNSAAGLRAHEQLGYRPRRWVVIPNGFDTTRYKPCASARRDFGRELGVADTVPLIGLLTRLHPMKDHATFLQAAAVVVRRQPAAHFVVAGRGVPESHAIRDLVATLGIGAHVHLLPERRDAPRILAALDVAVSSSYSEAFPNVVGEAMASGTPPVVTEAGDSAIIVGDCGRVVPPRNPAALAEAILEILAMNAGDREVLGLAGRARIIAEYSLSAAASRYQQLYEELSQGVMAQKQISCAE